MLQAYAPATLFRRMPAHWPRVFCIALAANFFVFFYGMAQHSLGSHEIALLRGLPLLYGVDAARWFAPFINSLSGFELVPVYTQTLAIIFQVLAGMGAVLVWKRDADFVPLLAGALFVSLIPFVTEFYFFRAMSPVFAFAQLGMVLALLAARKRNQAGFALAVLCMVLAFACYQSSVMTFGVLWCGLLAFGLAEWDGSPEHARRLAGNLALPLAALFLGALVYYLSISLVPSDKSIYVLQTAKVPLVERALNTVRSAFAHLWLSQPYQPRFLKVLLLLAVLGGVLHLLVTSFRLTPRKALLRTALLLVALLGLVVASKSQHLISASTKFYSYRFAGCGLTYVYLFFLTALLVSPAKLWRRLGLFCLCLAVPAFAVNDLRAQLHLAQSYTHDLAILNRVVARVEALENFVPGKPYTVVQFGVTPPYFRSAYPQRSYDIPGLYFQYTSLSPVWRPGVAMRLLSPYLRIGTRVDMRSDAQRDILEKAVRAAEKRRAFPARGSCFIMDSDILVLIFERKAVREIRERLERTASALVPPPSP